MSANKVLRLFQRVQWHVEKFYGERGVENGRLTEEFRRVVYLEVADCLLGGSKEALANEKLNEMILSTL